MLIKSAKTSENCRWVRFRWLQLSHFLVSWPPFHNTLTASEGKRKSFLTPQYKKHWIWTIFERVISILKIVQSFVVWYNTLYSLFNFFPENHGHGGQETWFREGLSGVHETMVGVSGVSDCLFWQKKPFFRWFIQSLMYDCSKSRQTKDQRN